MVKELLSFNNPRARAWL